MLSELNIEINPRIKQSCKLKADSFTIDENLLLTAMKETLNTTLTENGATALKSTLSPVLDFFAVAGALRSRSDSEIIKLFEKAYGSNPLYAMKSLFYARDIRGGLGERNTFRVILRELALKHPSVVEANLSLIPEYGRWDDLFVLFDTPLEKSAIALIDNQLFEDIKAYRAAQLTKTDPHISLLAKWMPSENASSPKTKALARKLAKALDFTPSAYRKVLTTLRNAIGIVEAKLSAQLYSLIDYEATPSLASRKYVQTFRRHDEERYKAYLAAVASGKAKINASVLYPYEVVGNYIEEEGYVGSLQEDQTTELLWKKLPDYVTDKSKSFLVMADVSGSMMGRPMATSVGLAIYFAEHNTGPFANHFITFTDDPELVEIEPSKSLCDKIKTVMHDVGYDTNLEAAFDLVLQSAIKNNVPQDQLPSAILVISDMEINSFGSHDKNTTFTDEMAARFAEAGYRMPTLIYWNVDSRNNIYHADATNPYVKFVSGHSPSVFKALCETNAKTPTELMTEVLDSDRYKPICLGSDK